MCHSGMGVMGVTLQEENSTSGMCWNSLKKVLIR